MNGILALILVLLPMYIGNKILFSDLDWELRGKKKYMRMTAFQKANPGSSYQEYLAWEKGDRKLKPSEDETQ